MQGRKASSTPPSSLPPDWIALYDPRYQRDYYFNQTTKQTTWKRPKHSLRTTSSGGGGEDRLISPPIFSQDQRNMLFENSNSPALNHGWKRTYSPQHQKHYYYNRSTGQSQWTSPFKNRSSPDTSSQTTQNSTLLDWETSSTSNPLPPVMLDEFELRENALRERLRKHEQVLSASRVAHKNLTQAKVYLTQQREEQDAKLKMEVDQSRLWVLAVLLCLIQILAFFRWGS